jgi:hypothetical protein
MKLNPIAGEYGKGVNRPGVRTVNWAALLVVLPAVLVTTTL